MIKRLIAFDFDGTLMNSPEQENGIQLWQDKMGHPYPHKGWWGRPESLDLNVFDIKPFPNVFKELEREVSTPDTYVIILTSRQEKLRPQLEAVLNKNDIHVDKVDMKRDEKNKGEKILQYIERFPDLQEICVYEDRDSDIQSYNSIKGTIPQNISFNIYVAANGNISLLEAKSTLIDIVNEEIVNLIKIL
jgi:hydroxymethylpyrimidine pyrophosphatase-like HAD family hydrolase